MNNASSIDIRINYVIQIAATLSFIGPNLDGFCQQKGKCSLIFLFFFCQRLGAMQVDAFRKRPSERIVMLTRSGPRLQS